METEIFRLNLISPLYYSPGGASDPFGYGESPEGAAGTEKLFCFELEETQFRNIEPDRDKCMGSLAFYGVSVPPKGTEKGKPGSLPQGNYLFAQKRELLNRETIINLAIELQQEALWQRLVPGKALYLRYLYEDGRPVTQLFRPYTER